MNIDKMAQDWDQRAQINPMFYVLSSQWEWDLQKFYVSGQREFESNILPFLTRQGFSPSDKVGLEVGCGLGRVTTALANHFISIYGIDVSHKMLKHAKKNTSLIYPDHSNIVYIRGSGCDLSFIETSSIDFCYSGIVFQHIPDAEIVKEYIREIARVLKPGGILKIQVNTSHILRLYSSLKHKITKPVADLIAKLPVYNHTLHTKAEGVHRIVAPKTWIGTSFFPWELRRLLFNNKLRAIRITGEWSQYTWVEAICEK